MPFEKSDKLLFECSRAVVGSLAFDVSYGVAQTGDPDTEGAVAFLPGEISHTWKRIMHPFRRSTFKKLNRLCNGKRRGQGNEQVDMVLYAAHRQGLHFVFSGDAAEVGPKAIT